MGRFNKDKRDYYYRRAKEVGFRARSAFKLLQIDEEFGILKGVKNAVDLCAAPGSWSQVLSRRLLPVHGVVTGMETLPVESGSEYSLNLESSGPITSAVDDGSQPVPQVKIVAVDLQEMAPIPGVAQLQGDITSRGTAASIIGHFQGQLADVVICDGAPDVTGWHELDEWGQAQLLASAANIAIHVLRPGGTFLAKMFTGPTTEILRCQLAPWFTSVTITKPRSSRGKSHEAFVLAIGYAAPEGFVPSMDIPAIANGTLAKYDANVLGGPVNALLGPWLAVGDLAGCSTGTGTVRTGSQTPGAAADEAGSGS